MAAGDAIQVGAAFLIGVGETYYLGHTVMGITYALDADENVHKDIRGATDSILTKDPRTMLDITLDMIGASADFAPPAKNSIISTKGPDDDYPSGWRVVSASTGGSENPARMTLSLQREDSMRMEFDDGEITMADDWDISDDADHAETMTEHGADDVGAVYGNGTVMTETTDWNYNTTTAVLTIESAYIGGIIVDPADELSLKICPNYGPTLTLTLTGIA